LSRISIEPRKDPRESPRIEVLFNLDDAIKKVGKPNCSEKWKDKEAVIAREMRKQGFSCTQIAEYLGYSISTVKRRLRRR
jgi:DNA-binding NarL/FixJ family response regulator